MEREIVEAVRAVVSEKMEQEMPEVKREQEWKWDCGRGQRTLFRKEKENGSAMRGVNNLPGRRN